MWEGGAAHPLPRWARCSAVNIGFAECAVGLLCDPTLTANLLTLPFAGQPVESLRRITDLTLAWPADSRAAISPIALATLLQRLPGLRRVRLHAALPSHPLHVQQLYDALGSLPHLEELELPACRALDRICTLARCAGLRGLTVLQGGPASMDAAMAHAVLCLQGLTRLRVELWCGGDAEEALLRQLLAHAPAPLRALELPQCGLLDPGLSVNAALQLRGRRVTSMELTASGPAAAGVDGGGGAGAHVELFALAGFAGRVLLPSGALAERLDSVRVHAVAVAPSALGTLGGPEGESLRSLLQRAACVEVGAARFHALSPGLLDFAWVILGLLRVPRRLELRRPRGSSICLRLRRDGVDPRVILCGSACWAFTPAGGAVSSLVELALEGMRAAVWRSHAEPAGGAAAPHRAAGGGAGADGGQLGHPPPPLLLLEGTLLHGLAWAPQVLYTWVQALLCDALARVAPEAASAAATAITAALAAGSDGWAAVLEEAVFLILPAGSGVLVQCGELITPELVTAAARAAGAAAARGGMFPSLLVSAVASVPPACPRPPPCAHLEIAFTRAVEQAAQAVWDGEGRFGSWSVRQRLQWLLEQWVQVHEMQAPMTITGY